MTLSISLYNLGKKFNREWIFRGLNFEIQHNQKLLVLGGNGSGKSTLLQVVSGFLTPNEGEVSISVDEKKIDPEKTKNIISFASPYLQLIEDFTLVEMIEHTKVFKPFVNNLSNEEIIEIIQLQNAKHKFIKQFSSGMKQRLKLGLAILADSPLLLLDEPVSNLDKNAIAWYKELISRYTNNRTVIVCSNAIADEHFFCDSELNVTDYK
ncbi:ABC transporter ATP-binding protein [Aurantibacillus circumpalustris]|uniref:ABC transporter ATP-binding protein n=1 Tax=Aurantibacillus circumpalustris TaxID=3036359 RepID=UPI00295BA20A|nr:ATP-binding cassette domain-containing protein [Aurantibacillus circumpalustris]